MPDTSSLLFDSARQAAETLSDPRLQSQLFAELAQQQLAAGHVDAALQTFALIHEPAERRVALLLADYQSFPAEKVEPLLQLLKAHPQTHSLPGRIALAMLEAKNTAASWTLIETAETDFESEQQRYDFLEKMLPLLRAGDWTNITHLYRSFSPGTYQDWALLALTKYLASQQRYDEAETFADALALPLRRSWAYWEIFQLAPAGQSERSFDKAYFDKAITIIETVEADPADEETKENLARQLRIFGQAAFRTNRQEWGERLLERSESVAASLTMPMQRYRLQCFLGKVLVELKQIASIREYLAIEPMLESLRSNVDRSRVSVWLAEAGWTEGWTRAITAMSVPERGIAESERVRQIADILKRFVAHRQHVQASGDPLEDRIRLSGEEFETRYFNPFAQADCEC